MLQHYKTIFIALIAAVGGILIEKSLNTQDDATNDNHAIANISTDDSANTRAQLQQQIHLLKTENSLLRDRLSAFANNSSAPKDIQNNIKPKSDSVTANKDMLNRLQTLEMEKQQRKADDIIGWIADSQKSNKNFNLNEALSNHFEQESRDSAWAEQQEHHYRQLFNTSEELRDIALRNTQCRTSQCEITVGITNSEQSNQLLQAMTKALASDGHPVAIMVATDEHSGTSKFYVSNNEDTFKFN